MQEKREIPVFCRGFPIGEAAILGVFGQARGPGLGRKRRVGHDEIEALERGVTGHELRLCDHVALGDLCRGAVVHDHVHPGEAPGGDIHLLPEDRDRDIGHLGGLQQQGPGPACRVIDGLFGAGRTADPGHCGDNPGHFGGGIELALGLPGLRREVAHQIFIGVAQNVVAIGAVFREVQLFPAEDVDQGGQGADHFLVFAELLCVVEEGSVDHPGKLVFLRDPGDDLVHPLADILGPAQGFHVIEGRACGNFDQRIGLTGAVRDVFHEQEGEDVIFIN